jgi:alkyldihydroxyacetonephosphate synthase
MTPWIPWTAEAAPAEPAWRWLAQSLGMPALLATPARPRSEILLPPSRLPDAARHKLAVVLGERLRTDDEARIAHAAKADAAGVLRLRGGDLTQAPDAVVCPCNEAEVLALLQICAQAGVAVGAGDGKHPARVICDIGGMSDILLLDAMSGLVQVQAGISSAELARQLAARGIGFGPAEFSSLGHWIGRNPDGVVEARLATPQGLLSTGALLGSLDGFGIVTAATLRIRAVPASTLHLEYLFPDFASGLAALREAQRECGAQMSVRLSDAEETRFHRRLAAMTKPATRMQRMTDIIRGQPGDGAAALRLTISGGAADVETSRKRFAVLARKLGAKTWAGVAAPDYRPLLNRGVTLDSVRVSATWSNLPGLYAALRNALDQTMRLHAPRAGAHGLVLAQMTDVRHDGASLTCTFLFPRLLNGDVAQAQAVRRAALDVLAAQEQPACDAELRRAIGAVLDPGGIFTSEEC